MGNVGDDGRAPDVGNCGNAPDEGSRGKAPDVKFVTLDVMPRDAPIFPGIIPPELMPPRARAGFPIDKRQPARAAAA